MVCLHTVLLSLLFNQTGTRQISTNWQEEKLNPIGLNLLRNRSNEDNHPKLHKRNFWRQNRVDVQQCPSAMPDVEL